MLSTSSKVMIGVVGVAVVGFLYWVLAPFVVNKTMHEVSPLTPTSQGNIPVLPFDTAVVPSLLSQGEFASREHETSGVAQVINDTVGEVLRLENLDSLNGPDLKVYLATDETATDFIDLGALKANRGDTNYSIPAGTDLTKYNKVLIWCRAFEVLFGAAELTPANR